ncbi:hypothetical protein QJQ45_012108 [Haematococcus lacustris]|nr:hypothetical protein QJQ45_012108 [Haematococcus lacustris]
MPAQAIANTPQLLITDCSSDQLRRAEGIHVQFDGCTCKKHGKVLVIRVTAAVPKGASPVTGAGSDLTRAAGQHQRLTAQITDVLAIVPLPCATAEAHVKVILRELERNGLQGARIVSMTADSAFVNMGGHSGVIAQLNDVLMPLQNTAIRAQPCYSHGLHNTLLAGLTALGAGIKAAIEDIASLLAQHWGELTLARSGAKPETPCDTRWVSYTTASASVLRVWRLAGEAVARVVEGQRERSPPWAVTLSGYFKDTDLLLKICVVAVVGMSLLQPELLWASQHDGLHAFELYRHTQDVQTSLSQTWTSSSQLLLDMRCQLQHLAPAQQRQQQEQQLLAYLQLHCQAMSSYYEQHVLRDHEGQHRLAAAYALTYDGRDYSHTTVEEANKLSVRELQAYLRFHQQEVMKGWLKLKLKGLVMAHVRNTVAALHGDELGAAAGAGVGAAPDPPPPPAAPPWQQLAASASAALGLLTPPLVAAPEEQQGTTTEMSTSSTRKRKAGMRDRTQPTQQGNKAMAYTPCTAQLHLFGMP